jgi:hypothetical protein
MAKHSHRRLKSNHKKLSKKHRSSKKHRKGGKTYKQKGGMCYGRGYGANTNDPNYSIFNTNMMKLFPYKTQ